MNYTNAEMTDMHFMYGLANGNASKARRLYSEAYPNRNLPSDKLFTTLHQRLSEVGSFKTTHHDAGRPRSVCTPAVEGDFLRMVNENPGTSVRRISAAVNINASLVWKVLRQQQLYPYHLQRVQELVAPDYVSRRTFCEVMMQKLARNPIFHAHILFTDEASFTKDGIINFHNNHVWADENPHAVLQSRSQYKFSVNVWLGILGDRLIGPTILPNRLTGVIYLDFLRNTLPLLLEDVPLQDRLQIWFMHDGAPAHFATIVRNFLNNEFNDRWIGRGGSILWPPRSPDLNPLDFFAWGYLKSLVYSAPVDNLENLQQRIEDACETIRQSPGVFERVRNSFVRRCQSCLQMEGGHVEHLI